MTEDEHVFMKYDYKFLACERKTGTINDAHIWNVCVMVMDLSHDDISIFNVFFPFLFFLVFFATRKGPLIKLKCSFFRKLSLIIVNVTVQQRCSHWFALLMIKFFMFFFLVYCVWIKSLSQNFRFLENSQTIPIAVELNKFNTMMIILIMEI